MAQRRELKNRILEITDAPEDRFNLGVERFLAGETVAYQGIVFYKDGSRALKIDSFSAWEPERSTEAHAHEGISKSKAVLQDLAFRNEAFRAIAERLPHEYAFCYDYGMGSVALAMEIEGEFHWLTRLK
jgi:hypothetical protein